MSLLASYQLSPDSFDEFLLPDGRPRPHCVPLLNALGGFERETLQGRAETARRLIYEQGITYHVYNDPRGVERPWQLDPIPMILAPNEWRQLEAGLIQRARLLDQILADCYGPQQLIHSRWLSPALVFGQPAFLRPCHGVRTVTGRYLHFYAADLARSPDGRWWVLSDRTQIPTGAGYSLANRLVTSRVLPESFRENHIQRLAGYFRDVQNSLAQLSPRQEEKPRIVLLSPGPQNETYFEQAYMARYLGYLLVEGQDLTVRDDKVFLKTLSGLEQVDVIMRRQDDDFCDPLELRNDSILGIPGLVEALRAGNISIANALGSGLVQSPAFMPFLPGLCRQMLGEDLLLPSVNTWWCGQKPAEDHVLANLDALVIKPAFRADLQLPNPDGPLSGKEREILRRQISFQPDEFVAQERVKLSTAPAWENGRLVAAPVGLRMFLVAGGDGSYRVMPGALTRIAPRAHGDYLSLQLGGSSKDTWVMSEVPVDAFTLLQSYESGFDLRPTGNHLPSRLADNFFWLGRYAERADATARVVRSALVRFNPEQHGRGLKLLEPLLKTLEAREQLPAAEDTPEIWQNAEAFEAELLAVILDGKKTGSLLQIADHLQRLAMAVRERTSNDMWRVLSDLNDRLARPPMGRIMFAGEALGILDETLIGLAAFHGLARENMTRGQAWRFVDVGLRIERADFLCTLLQTALHEPQPDDPSLLEAVLEVADSSITFRSRYHLLPHIPSVVELVLLEEKNPRSVMFQVRQLMKHFSRLPQEREEAIRASRDALQECHDRLGRIKPGQLVDASGALATGEVNDTIQQLLRVLPRISRAIEAAYFAHSRISRTGRGSEV